MNLQELNSALPKPWLNIKSNSLTSNTANIQILTVDTLDVNEVLTNELVLVNQSSVPNPAIGSMALFTDTSTGKLNATNPLGDTVQYVTEDELKQDNITLESVQNQVEPVAPFGQRDLWTASSSNSAGELVYSPYLDILWASPSSGLSYSNNGGASFTNCVFDHTPTFVSVGFNSSLVVALDDSGQAFTSPDGINFTRQASGLSIKVNADYIMFFNGLFIASDYNTAGMGMASSPDGITWSSHPTTFIADNYSANSQIAVSVGSTRAPYGQYSLDGIVWVDLPTPLSENSQSVAWSQDKQQWMILTAPSGLIYTSLDGIHFTLSSAVGPTFTWGLLWLGAPYDRWYTAALDSAGNLGLWTTIDSSLSFVSTHLDGSIKDSVGQHQPFVYMPSRKSFALSPYTGSPICIYSTSRPFDLKAVSDNIRVRGFPVMVGNFSSYADVNINNTTTETSILSASALGSMVLQASQPQGMYMKIVTFMNAISAAGDTLTIRVKNQAGTIQTIVIAIPVTAGIGVTIKIYLTVRSATIQCNSEFLVSATANVTTISNVAYNPAIENTFNITAQWGANVNQLDVNQVYSMIGFRNGA